MISVSKTSFHDSNDKVFLVFIILAAIVMISPLGIMPLLDDEPIRALVSVEMYLSGNYWVPTTNGALYLNKPPLFNWLITGLMHVIPNFSEFHLRLPSLLVLMTMSVCTYYFFKKEIGEKVAMFSALAFLTCGRILFVDSMLGYIDPFFSLAIFLNLFLLYKIDVRSQPWLYFLLSYLLCLVAFMLKGLPALVFQAISVSVALYLKDNLRKLFSIQHLAGASIFIVGLVAYYLVYSMYESLDSLFATLWEQSSKRTVTNFNLWDGILYVLGFPFEFAMHFLPWTLLIVFCIRKDIVRIIRSNEFVKYAFVIFASNIWIYWLSPETRPRYLFMFLPFYFAILFYVFIEFTSEKQKRITHYVVLSLSVLMMFASLSPFFISEIDFVEFKTHKILVIFLSLFFLVLFIWKRPQYSMLSFVAVLLIARLGFNFFVLPSRKLEAPETQFKKFGEDIGKISNTEPIYLLDACGLDNDISYYISKTNHKILGRKIGQVKEGEYYICEAHQLEHYRLKPVYQFYTDWEHKELFVAEKKVGR
jgi:4-amino-4-deoxy-L-arabinose transferase-like glycosyltransferase